MDKKVVTFQIKGQKKYPCLIKTPYFLKLKENNCMMLCFFVWEMKSIGLTKFYLN